jgi:ATP-binding cassette subfamily B protein
MAMHEDVIGKAYDARLMRRLLGYLRPHRHSVVLALAAIVGHSMMQLTYPYLTKVAIDQHILTGDLTGLNQIVLLFLAILLASFLLEYLETYTMQMMGQRIMYDLRIQIYSHLQSLDVQFYDRNPVGRLMTRVTTDVDALNDLFASGVIAVFRDVFTLLGIMVILLVMDWRLALVAFSVLPLIAAVTHWFRKHARQSYRRVRGWIARINSTLQESITGMTTIQLFRQEQRSFDEFDGLNRSHRDANVDSIFYYATFYPAINFLGALATALIIWFGGGWTLENTLTLGSLVAFLQYAARFFRPISDLSEKFNILQSAMASSERVFGLLDTPIRVTNPATTPEVTRDQRGRIVFDHVWFAYHDENVLRDVSFSIEPGERVGIVGATGSGKTTLINLLLRFYDVGRGSVSVDGIDIRRLPLSTLRRRFGLVLQDGYLFSGTVRDNVAMGQDDLDDDTILATARHVHADRVIDRSTDGLDSLVVERGATLSAGEKQLLSFARALAYKPEILILDEATSNVDTDTEFLIQNGLRTLMEGRTTIAIAHRLSTVQDMDRILVFHRGELRESGSHQELLALRGIYYRLYQLQYKDQEDRRSVLDDGVSEKKDDSI